MRQAITISILLYSFILSGVIYAQLPNNVNYTTNGTILNDTVNQKFNKEKRIELGSKVHYTDYKIISYTKDTTYIDTTLTIKHDKVFNLLKHSTFELMPLHNQGQSYNKLGYDFTEYSLFPKFGVRAKQYGFYNHNQVQYYRVPTPTSELFFRTGIQQGQLLNSLLTFNINPELNISLAYKGIRSTGNYRSALASHQNLRLTASYQIRNRYIARMHYTGQNLFHEENGGLTPNAIALYQSNNKDYLERERLETNFTNAESRFKTRGYYLEHGYNLWYQEQDSTHKKSSYLQIGHEFIHDRQFYTYNQNQAHKMFGEAYYTKIQDSTAYFKTTNTAYATLKSPWILGKARFNASYTSYKYGYSNIIYKNNVTIPAKYKDYITSIDGFWDTHYKGIDIMAKAGTTLTGNSYGQHLSGTAQYKTKDSLLRAKAMALIYSKSPNLNQIFYQSGYKKFNWYNNLQNENSRILKFEILSDKILDVSASITNTDYYTYFNENSLPTQLDSNLNYMKLKAHKDLHWRKWTLDNTIMYQKVTSGKLALHIPRFITKNSLYFTDYIFKGNPLYLQTGITFKYFTKYYADEFNPLLNEFYVQNEQLIGAYPLLDFFANGQVKRFRFFLKAENLNSLWDKGKYLTTPTQPYRDFTVRFGLIWIFKI